MKIRDFGRQRVLEICTLGKEIHRDFMDPRIGSGTMVRYKRSAEGQQMHNQLVKLKQSDAHIGAIAVFASGMPEANPRGIVLDVGDIGGFSSPKNPFMDNEVLGWKGDWTHHGVAEEALFFRAPISGRGDQLTATANLILPLRSFEKDANALVALIVYFGLALVVATFVISYLTVRYVRLSVRPEPRADP